MKPHYLILAVCLFSSTLFAQSPRTFSYQGFLLDEGQSPVTGTHHITVRLYDTPVEGTLMHSENFNANIENGIFSLIIGSQEALETSLHFDRQYWIGVSIDDGAEM